MLKKQIPGYFKQRRERLMAQNPDAAFILYSGPEQYRNSDVEYPFRAESNFYYLTGFTEPDAILVILGAEKKSILFVRPRDRDREIWNGERYGVDRAVSLFGADEAYAVEDFSKKIETLLESSERIFYRMGLFDRMDRKILDHLEGMRRRFGRSGKGILSIHDYAEVIGEMRLFKGPEEIELLRKAGHHSAMAHRTLMKEVRAGMNEREIDALFEYSVKLNGCGRLGYGSIVAAGSNATCLHYRDNNDSMREGDLLLVDAAGEVDHYCADITRTFPISKSYSPAQARIYDLVLKTQKAVIQHAKPGVRYTSMHEMASELLAEGLLSLGLLKGSSPQEVIKSGEIKRFYPHGTGHLLGMDVHDVGLYLKKGESRKLEPGMCFTVEPGLYFQPSDKDVPDEYRGIGIRIEDDILVTSNGTENLTAEVPKERSEIEALRA